MPLFQSVRHFYEILGIHPTQYNQSCTINWKNVLVLLSLGQLFFSTLAFCLFKAKSIKEHADSYFTCMTGLDCIIHFVVLAKKITKTLALIEQYNDFIENGELNIFTELMLFMCFGVHFQEFEILFPYFSWTT